MAAKKTANKGDCVQCKEVVTPNGIRIRVTGGYIFTWTGVYVVDGTEVTVS